MTDTTTDRPASARPAVGRLGGLTIDSARPAELGAFYAALFGVEIRYQAPEYAGMQLPNGVWLLVQGAPDHVPPRWQDAAAPQQLHLDVAVDDLEAGVAAALELGATLAEPQPQPERWRVLIDPSGHPFCLTAMQLA